tara:strand:- start:140 stop:385 length:246 start_codon:yes stop_codon:yes gene_type:complete
MIDLKGLPNLPNMNLTLTPEELSKLLIEAEAEIKKGRKIEELFQTYQERYSIQEAFFILMQVKMREVIDPEFHNFTGKTRK